MKMNESCDLLNLQEELKVERERVAKLKAIVIREKKNNSNLTTEVERISSCLEELKQNNATLQSELQQLRRPSAQNSSSDKSLQISHPLTDSAQPELEEKLQNAEHALALSLDQLAEKDTAVNALSLELNEIKSQLAVAKENERKYTSAIKQLKSELSVNWKELYQSDDKDQLLLETAALEKTPAKECEAIETPNMVEWNHHVRELSDLITALKEREIKTVNRLKEQELQNKQLSEALSEFRKRDTVQGSVMNETTLLHQQADLLIDKLHVGASRKPCLIDCAQSSKLETATLDDMCREFLSNIRPFVDVVSSDNSNFRLTESDFGCLLDRCAQLLTSCHGITSEDVGLKKAEQYFMDSVHKRSDLSLLANQETQCDMLNLTHANHLSTNEAAPKSDDLKPCPLKLSATSVSSQEHEFGDKIDLTNDADRLHMLEVKVNDLEKYAAEQEDRAKLQIMDWSQKLEIQAHDYDHLIRGKEAEISELRETCDRLSEEVSTYLNFCSSLMIYVGESDSSSNEQVIDWPSIADMLNSNESSMSGYELSGLLETLFREVKSRLEAITLSEFQSSSEPVVSQEPGNSQYELDEVKEQLVVITKSLEQANKRATEAETTAGQLQDEIGKRDEKIQRMKQLLIRLKLDANGQQKMLATVEEAESAKQRLIGELDCRNKELEEANVARERAESALLTTREELSQLRVVMDSVKEERDSAIRRLSKLQSEYNAYKVKAVHTLRNSHSHDPASSFSESVVSKSSELEENALSNDSVTYKAEVERLNNQLVTTQQQMEEASLRASLARTECDLIKEDLVDLRKKYSELLKEFREQRTLWETKLGSLTREREHFADDRIRELEQKLDEARAQFEEQLQSEQARHQRMVCDERTMWTAKLDKVTEENKVLQEELETVRRNRNAFQGHELLSKPATVVQNQSMDTYPLSPHHTRGRMQGDGADNVTDEFDGLSVSQLSLGHSGGFEERQNLDTPRPLLLPLDQLLNKSGVIPRTTSSVSTTGGSLSPRYHSGDPDLNGTLGLPMSASTSSQIAGLRVALTNQQRRVEHLSELLNESEANVARLEEQAKVLKEEIRRLERIAQRESQFTLPNSVPNSPTPVSDPQVKDGQLRTEYLKNIILKLVCSPTDCAERPQLISVLSSLLLLSPSEQKALQDGVNSSQSAPGGVSWASYLVGWSSFKG